MFFTGLSGVSGLTDVTYFTGSSGFTVFTVFTYSTSLLRFANSTFSFISNTFDMASRGFAWIGGDSRAFTAFCASYTFYVTHAFHYFIDVHVNQISNFNFQKYYDSGKQISWV